MKRMSILIRNVHETPGVGVGVGGEGAPSAAAAAVRTAGAGRQRAHVPARPAQGCLAGGGGGTLSTLLSAQSPLSRPERPFSLLLTPPLSRCRFSLPTRVEDGRKDRVGGRGTGGKLRADWQFAVGWKSIPTSARQSTSPTAMPVVVLIGAGTGGSRCRPAVRPGKGACGPAIHRCARCMIR